MKTTAIIVAAGNAARLQNTDKLFLNIGGKTVLRRCVEQFEAAGCVEAIVVVARADRCEAVERELFGITKLTAVVPGGQTRQQSAAAGAAAAGDADFYAIHDGARPFVTPALIEAVLAAAVKSGAAAAAVPVKDTIKRVDADEIVCHTPDRGTLRACQTPQIFSAPLYRKALMAAALSGKTYTDDCQLVEAVGAPVKLVPGSEDNRKITTWEDVAAARLQTGEGERTVRIGHGYDVHRLVEGRPLIIGGVRVPCEKGLLGHSDADVAVHALIDALLGAAALGDIGKLFPDSDERYRGIDSLLLLSQVMETLWQRGYAVGNLDLTVIAQRPKLAGYIDEMRERIAAVCRCPAGAVSVKATTTEGLGFAGRGEGVAAEAVCLLCVKG